jgi:hypothetical protein
MTVDSGIEKPLMQCVADAKTIAEQISIRLQSVFALTPEDVQRALSATTYSIDQLQHLKTLLTRQTSTGS